jgi:hypothetical protein
MVGTERMAMSALNKIEGRNGADLHWCCLVLPVTGSLGTIRCLNIGQLGTIDPL